ncbi:hypothetical protein AMTRI_Chr02g262260 [Amborella trichopoda]
MEPHSTTKHGSELPQELDPSLYEKPSTLSNIEFKDSRFPITQAIEIDANESGESDAVGLVDERSATADVALELGRRMFEEARQRGIPQIPASRVLRELLKKRGQTIV